MTNYIVSGLERSGTSLMMQILEEAGFPVQYDDKRKADMHNPKGYYEIHKGLVIKNLMNGRFNNDTYKDNAIKITSYGLRYLPKGNYKIIYMMRDIFEVWKSQEKMRNKLAMVSVSDEKMRDILKKMNEVAISKMDNRNDIDYIIVSYNKLITNPLEELHRISDFLDFDVTKGKSAIDMKLYRCQAGLQTRLTPEEEKIIEERLKELGYLS